MGQLYIRNGDVSDSSSGCSARGSENNKVCKAFHSKLYTYFHHQCDEKNDSSMRRSNQSFAAQFGPSYYSKLAQFSQSSGEEVAQPSLYLAQFDRCHLIDTHLSSFALPPILNVNEIEICAIYQCLLNLPTTLSTEYLICSVSQVSLRKLHAKENLKFDTSTAQTLHLLHILSLITIRY